MGKTRLLLIAVLVLSFAASNAFASDIRIIFDPGSSDPGPSTTIIYPGDIGMPLSATWESCSSSNGIPPSLNGETACIALDNLSNQSISELTIDFTVAPSSPLIGQTVTCGNTDGFLTGNNCPAGALTAGQQVSITFSGGTAVPSGRNMWFGADAAGLTSPGDFPGVTITAAPEPSTLLLLPIGVLMLGFGFGWKRRATV